MPSETGDQAAQQRPVSIARRLSARPVDDAKDVKMGLELWGTILGKPSMAFIFNPDTNQQGLFNLNDNVQGFRLVKISSGKVVLEKDGDAWELILTANNKNRSAGGKAVVFSDPASGTIVVNRLQMMAQMLRAKDILGSVKIFPIPDPVTSKLGGFRVDNVPAGSLIEDVGIKNGDVIYSVQGQKLQTIQDAWSMFAKVQTQSRVEVVLMRNNEPVTIKYEIK
jgi:type II secretion system protein C